MICGANQSAEIKEAYAFVADAPGHWTGVNVAQRLVAGLSSEGIRIQPLDEPATAWEWRFALVGSGSPGALAATGDALPSAVATRAEMLRGRTTEWFVNGLKGIEHGLEIPDAPAGGPLWLDFLVGGGLTPKPGDDGETVVFADARGLPALQYRDLRVVDTHGREVDARWERVEDGEMSGLLRLVVATGERAAPFRIMGRIVAGKGGREASAIAPARSSAAPEGAFTPADVAPMAAPINDLCPGAEVIPGAGPFPYLGGIHDVTDATLDGDPPPPSCQANVSRSIWFKFTPQASSWYTFSLCEDAAAGSTVPDTVLAVYAAGGDCTGLAEIAGGCDDDSCATQDFQSVLADLSLSAGTTYYVVAWIYGDTAPDPAAATIQLRVAQTNPPTPAPPNDQCPGAEVIPAAGPFPWISAVTADIGGAGTAGDPPAPSCQANVSRSIWYAFTPAATGRYSFSVCADAPTGTTVDDTVLALYASAGGCSGLAQVPGACDDDSCAAENAQSVIHGASLAAGTTYYVVAWQYGSAAPAPANTAVQLRVSQVTGPANDACETATDLPLAVALAGTTTSALDDYELPAGSACFTGIGQTASTAVGRDVVYRFTAPAAGRYSFRTGQFPSTRNAVLHVAEGCPSGNPPLVLPACLAASNRNATGPAEEITCLALAGGQAVYVYVDENSLTTGGPFTIEAEACASESEPDNLPADGELACGTAGAIGAAGDVDFFSLGVPEAGARLFALAEGAAANSTDFDLRLTTATDTLEYDDQNNDTPFGSAAPNLSGAPLSGAEAFLRVNHSSPAGVAEPYRLYAAVQPAIGAAAAEIEPNGTTATATSAPGQYYSGALSSTGDIDHFAFNATAGDRILVGLDLDPLRNNTPFNGSLALLDASGNVLQQVNDPASTSSTASGAGSLSAAAPYSPGEAIAWRARSAGTYYARVAPSGSSIGDYLLSIALECRVLPATDLAVTQADTPDPAAPGAPVTYTVTVRNLGTRPATGVILRDDPPAGAAVGTATPSQGTCGGTAPVTCHLGTLGAGATATVSVTVTAPASPGAMVNEAKATTYVFDSQPGNDGASETTIVANPDTDGDGVLDASDCAPADPAAWTVPGEAVDLFFPPGSEPSALQWSAPAVPGGTVVYYDLLRSTVAGDFSAATCVASGITATAAGDPTTPATRYHYLVRARNACGGNLGVRSDGTPRTGAACP